MVAQSQRLRLVTKIMLFVAILFQGLVYTFGSGPRSYVELPEKILGGDVTNMKATSSNAEGCKNICDGYRYSACVAFMYYTEWFRNIKPTACILQGHNSVANVISPFTGGSTYIEKELYCNVAVFGWKDEKYTKIYNDTCLKEAVDEKYPEMELPDDILFTIPYGPEDDLIVCKMRCNAIPNCVMINHTANCTLKKLKNPNGPIVHRKLEVEQTLAKGVVKQSAFCKKIGPKYYSRTDVYANLCLDETYCRRNELEFPCFGRAVKLNQTNGVIDDYIKSGSVPDGSVAKLSCLENCVDESVISSKTLTKKCVEGTWVGCWDGCDCAGEKTEAVFTFFEESKLEDRSNRWETFFSPQHCATQCELIDSCTGFNMKLVPQLEQGVSCQLLTDPKLPFVIDANFTYFAKM